MSGRLRLLIAVMLLLWGTIAGCSSISLQHYRMDQLFEEHARLRIRMHELTGPAALHDDIDEQPESSVEDPVLGIVGKVESGHHAPRDDNASATFQ